MPNDIPTTQFEADFDAVEERQSTTFTFSGSEYSGIINARTDTDATRDPGFIREFAFSISCKVSQFSTVPNIGATFTTLNSGSYQVMERTYSADRLVIVFDLDTIHK